MTSARAGKIGFCSSGSTSPTSRARSPRSCVGRSYLSTSRAVSTASLVLSDTPALPLSTRLTVASLTPTFLATSASRLAGGRGLRELPLVAAGTVGVMPQRYDTSWQEIARPRPVISWPARNQVVSLQFFVHILHPDVCLSMLMPTTRTSADVAL